MKKGDIAEIEICYKRRIKARHTLKNAADAYRILKKCFNVDTLDHHETFWALYLNNSGQPLAVYKVAEGTISSVEVDSRMIFQAALKLNATQIILAHNHSSGLLEPSKADLKVTALLQNIGLLMNIKILDHLIISSEGYYSMNENDRM